MINNLTRLKENIRGSSRNAPRDIIVILGPTASGKSRLGVRLAKKFHGIIISADSRQVYRGLNIGTGKIPKKERHGIPHFLLDVAPPRSQYSVARYARDVQRVLKNIPLSTPVFLVGGSALYIKAVTEPGWIANVPPNPKLRRRLEKMTTAQLVNLLRQKLPERILTIDRANRRRLIRAIEVAVSMPSPELGRAARGRLHSMLKIGLAVPRATQFRRIDRQIAHRLRRGMIRETMGIHRQGVSWKRIEALGLEYRVLVQHLRGQLTRAEAETKMRTVTHDFARRQTTWWKHDQDIRWVTSDQQALRLCRKFLTTNSSA